MSGSGSWSNRDLRQGLGKGEVALRDGYLRYGGGISQVYQWGLCSGPQIQIPSDGPSPRMLNLMEQRLVTCLLNSQPTRRPYEYLPTVIGEPLAAVIGRATHLPGEELPGSYEGRVPISGELVSGPHTVTASRPR